MLLRGGRKDGCVASYCKWGHVFPARRLSRPQSADLQCHPNRPTHVMPQHDKAIACTAIQGFVDTVSLHAVRYGAIHLPRGQTRLPAVSHKIFTTASTCCTTSLPSVLTWLDLLCLLRLVARVPVRHGPGRHHRPCVNEALCSRLANIFLNDDGRLGKDLLRSWNVSRVPADTDAYSSTALLCVAIPVCLWCAGPGYLSN